MFYELHPFLDHVQLHTYNRDYLQITYNHVQIVVTYISRTFLVPVILHSIISYQWLTLQNLHWRLPSIHAFVTTFLIKY